MREEVLAGSVASPPPWWRRSHLSDSPRVTRDTAQAMSQENVEVVRRFYEAVNRRDLAVLDGLLASEESEFASVFATSEGRVFRGRQGNRDYFAAIDEAFEDFRTEILELIDAGEDRVVAMTRVTGRGKGSGIPVDKRFGQVWTLRDEAVVRIDTYVNPPDALEAAGLWE